MSKKKGKVNLTVGIIMVAAFVVWTIMVCKVDVQPLGQNGTDIGFATFNTWFHNLTGVNMVIYDVTDILGLVPFMVCFAFACLGAVQIIKRRSLFKVDSDILLLGAYYIIVIQAYLFFEVVPINYRPIPIEGVMEVSYPSSTTLLVLAVMPTLIYQVQRRMAKGSLKRIISIVTTVFIAFMVIGRLVCGVHWFTDIIGGALLSVGLFMAYTGAVALVTKNTQAKAEETN